MKKQFIFIMMTFILCAISISGTELTHGPITGRASSRSMRIWVRTSEPAEFHIVYGETPELTDESSSVSGKTLATNDNTGTVDITDLKPDTKYYYAVKLNETLITEYGHRKEFPFFRTWLDSKKTFHKKHNPRGLCNL